MDNELLRPIFEKWISDFNDDPNDVRYWLLGKAKHNQAYLSDKVKYAWIGFCAGYEIAKKESNS